MTFPTITSSLPAIQAVFDVARGGAVAVAQAAASSGVGDSMNDDETRFLGLSAKPRAVLCMAIAMSLHYLGYSFARPSTIALFTSTKTGYQSPAAFPLAMAFVSPMSLVLLMAYTRLLDQYGPRGALTRTTLYSASVLFMAATSIISTPGFQLDPSFRYPLSSLSLVHFLSFARAMCN
jgi:hypothetical protein